MVTHVLEKCIGCFPLIDKGEQPRCATACIGKIKMQGVMEGVKPPPNDNPIDMIVRIRKVAVPLYPQFGTQPNVYYVLPVHQIKDVLAYIKSQCPALKPKQPVKTSTAPATKEKQPDTKIAANISVVEEWIDAEYKLTSLCPLRSP